MILLHGWPYDIYSFVDVAPLLASAGFRVIVPYLRGYGPTRFLSNDTVRNGQPAARRGRHHRPYGRSQDPEGDSRRVRLGSADGQHPRCALAGALQSDGLRERLSHRQPGGWKMPLPPENELQWWYQFYFATERGRAGYDKYRRDFAKLIWQLASRSGTSMTPRSIAARNPSTTRITSRIVIHNYRWRLSLAEGESKYDALEKRLAERSGHHRAHDHSRRRRQRRAASGGQRLCRKVLGQVRAPDHHGRHRAQPASGSPAGLCRSRRRSRRLSIRRAGGAAHSHGSPARASACGSVPRKDREPHEGGLRDELSRGVGALADAASALDRAPATSSVRLTDDPRSQTRAPIAVWASPPVSTITPALAASSPSFAMASMSSLGGGPEPSLT